MNLLPYTLLLIVASLFTDSNLLADNDDFNFIQSGKLKIIVKNQDQFNLDFIILDLIFNVDSVKAVMVEDLNKVKLWRSKNH